MNRQTPNRALKLLQTFWNSEEEASFYSDIFNRKQNIFTGWFDSNFSDANLEHIISRRLQEKEVDKWIRSEFSVLLETFYPDEDFDPRRFVTLYHKGERNG